MKEQSLAAKNEVDREIKDRRAEISKQERRIQSKEDALDRKTDAMEKREADFTARDNELKKKKQKVDQLHDQAVKELRSGRQGTGENLGHDHRGSQGIPVPESAG